MVFGHFFGIITIDLSTAWNVKTQKILEYAIYGKSSER